MNNDLSALEEFDAQRKIEFPHLLHVASDLKAKKNIAYVVLVKNESELLLVSPSGFGEASVIAGLTEKNIEYFGKFAPKEYKQYLTEVMNNSFVIDDIFEIAKAMDDDEGDGQTRNQDRVKNVIRYVQDNWAVFQF